MKRLILGLALAAAPLTAFAGAADCVGAPAPLVKNQFSSSSLANLTQKGGTVRVFSSTRNYSTSSLSTIAKAGVDGGKGGKLILCVDDDYYSSSNLGTIAAAGAEVVLLN
jgi:hypothetical protein